MTNKGASAQIKLIRILSRETKQRLSPQLKEALGLGSGNIGLGTYLASAPITDA